MLSSRTTRAVDFIDGDSRGYARARCVNTPDIEKSVACGGFAAEVYLLRNGYAEQASDDKRDINQILLNNASMDGHAFWGREYTSEGFTEEETREFVNHAIGPDGDGGLVPIFNRASCSIVPTTAPSSYCSEVPSMAPTVVQ